MVAAFTGLKLVDFLGVFYRGEDGCLMVADELDGTRAVEAEVAHLEGREVRLLAHHRPVEPHDAARWGGGCCMHESAGRCPFGHHEEASRLYLFNEVGTFRIEDSRWMVGGETPTECLVDFLTGHRSQIVITSIPDLEKIEEKVKSFDPSGLENATLDELTDKLSEMRDFISEVQRLKDDVDA
jgi:hypothetical protein